MTERRTALVTGASSGLGLEFARLFAQDGYDLVLIARSGDRLRSLADELQARHEITALALAQDLAKPEAIGQITAALNERRVSVDAIVNSAGFTQFGPFVSSDERTMLDLLHVNVVALTALTHSLLPGMVERGRGMVVNMASNAAFQPGPFMACYYASKAYVLSFSIALADEVRGSGVTVTALCPGPTATGFQARGEIQDSKIVAGKRLATAAEVARWGYAVAKRGRPFAVHSVRWKMFAFGSRFLPRMTAARIARRAQERVHA